MKHAVWLAMVLLPFTAPACRSLDIPPVSEGRVSGRVVVAQPTGARDALQGVTARFAGTSLMTTTNENGLFSLAPVITKDGALVLEFDQDQDGHVDLQRSLSFSSWNIAPGHDTALGDVFLRESAQVRGRVELEGAPSLFTGLSGTAVLVPGSPWTTSTADDGTFSLANLPEGLLSLAFVHPGYEPKRMTDLELRGGEAFSLAVVRLTRTTSTGPGTLAGSVVATPPTDLSRARLTIAGRPSIALNSTGTFSLELAPGVYSALVSLEHYSDVLAQNLVVQSGQTTEVGTLGLTTGDVHASFPDAGDSDGGTAPLGCGDGLVTGAEVCDTGSLNGQLGCEPDCRSLKPQGPGGAGCETPKPIALVDDGKGGEHAIVFGQASFANVADPICLPNARNNTVTYTLDLATPSEVVVTSSSADTFLIRSTCTLGSTTRACSTLNGFRLTSQLPAGRYTLLQATNTPTGRVLVNVRPIRGSFCGDGTADPGEQCDDGNSIDSDACTAACVMKVNGALSTCLDTTALAWAPTQPHQFGARGRFPNGFINPAPDSPSGSCSSFTGSNGPASFLRVQLPRPGRLSVSVSDGVGGTNAFLLLWDVSALNCLANPPLVACADAATSTTELLTAPRLDAGTYLVGVGLSGMAQSEVLILYDEGQ